jgi:hypothetical protein
MARNLNLIPGSWFLPEFLSFKLGTSFWVPVTFLNLNLTWHGPILSGVPAGIPDSWFTVTSQFDGMRTARRTQWHAHGGARPVVPPPPAATAASLRPTSPRQGRQHPVPPALRQWWAARGPRLALATSAASGFERAESPNVR